MFSRIVIISFVLVFVKQTSFSQFIYYDQSTATDWKKVSEMAESGRKIRDSLQNLGYPAETFFLHHVGKRIWMSIDGRFDVFEWSENTWVNLYKGTFHGYNHKSEKFTYRDKLFSYRGYGFWREHGEIIEFLPEKGGWEIIPASQGLPFGVGYMRDSLFYIHADKCYSVHLLQQNIEPVSCQYTIRGEIPHGREYHFRDFMLVASHLKDGYQFPLIDKRTGDIYLSTRQPFKALRDTRITNAVIHVRDNDLTIRFPDDSVVAYHVADEMKYYLKESVPKGLKRYLLWSIAAVFFFAGGGLLMYKRRRQEKTINAEALAAFKEYEGKLIDSDTLDTILGIQDIIVYETRKFKRANMIKELNTISKIHHGQELILREKNPMDKRFYLYRIQSVNG